MTTVDTLGRQRDSLPSISNFDFEKYRMDKVDPSRFPSISSFTHPKSIISSPPTTYSAPPPSYSSAHSVPISGHSMSGYISPPESNSRRSTREEKESPKGTSLPSISEALKSAEMAPVPQLYSACPAPTSAVAQTFADAPKGPGNPFSQPTAPASALRSSVSSNSGIADLSPIKAVPPPPVPPDSRLTSLHTTSSPRSTAPIQRLPVALQPSNTPVDPSFRPSYAVDATRPGYPFPDYQARHTPVPQQPTNGFHLDHNNKLDDSRNPFTKSNPPPYGETVKRHLDVFDAELALNEITDASVHTLEFSKGWSQRIHQANRTSYVTESLPNTTEIDEVIRDSQHVLENLSRLREVAVMQQNALNEQRAHAARGQQLEDDFHGFSEDFKTGGFAGGDAKKRRGKAAPPGRCHSCNRAETPEWRRGPDGARTLCNACGLHYAKLTRKMGANKAAVMTGSNLRPKGLSETRP